MAIEHADEREVKRPTFLPEDMTDSEVHDLEFTIAFDSEKSGATEGSTMLDALTDFREEQYN